jgi:hypothetical protein
MPGWFSSSGGAKEDGGSSSYASLDEENGSAPAFFSNPLMSSQESKPPKEEWGKKIDEEFKSCCPNLSYEQRFYGFWICLGVGMALNVFAWAALFVSNYEGFAVLYTLGNITALCAAGFFTGPARQIKGGHHLRGGMTLLLIDQPAH